MSPPSTLPSILIIFLSLLQLSHSSDFFWGFYPACAQPQLDANVPADCMGLGTTCLCASSAFLTGSARDIWKHCGCKVLETSANVAQSICFGIGGMAVTPAQMVSAGDGGQSTCADPSGLASSTSSPSTPTSITSNTGSGGGSATSSSSSSNSNTSGQSSGGGGGGLTTSDQIVIGVVLPVIGIIVAIIGIVVSVKIKRGKTRGQQVP